jgi:hypothetical protein
MFRAYDHLQEENSGLILVRSDVRCGVFFCDGPFPCIAGAFYRVGSSTSVTHSSSDRSKFNIGGKIWVELMLWPIVSRPNRVGVGHPFGPIPRYFFFIFFFAWQLLFSSSWGALSDERTGLLFVVQSVSSQSPAGLITIYYCPIWDYWVPFPSPLTIRRDYGGSILTRLHTRRYDLQIEFEASGKRNKSHFQLNKPWSTLWRPDVWTYVPQ